jgi:Fe-S oxidoreductase
MFQLLSGLDGLTLVPLSRADECCGFGGSFAIAEPELSVAMGQARLDDYRSHDAEVLVSSDPSCLMHLDGVACNPVILSAVTRRVTEPKDPQPTPLRTMHIAELLEEATR